MWGHNARVLGVVHYRTLDRQGVRCLGKAKGIRLATLNIRLGRAGGLEAALRDLRQGNVDVGVLQETKLTDSIHVCQVEGYFLWVTKAENRHWGVVAVVWREDARWQVEGIFNFGPNVESFLLTLGSQRWYVVGAYVPPHGMSDVHHIKQDLEEAPKRMEVILLGDLSVRLREPWDEREDEIVSTLVGSGLVNVITYFMPRRRYKGTRSWTW